MERSFANRLLMRALLAAIIPAMGTLSVAGADSPRTRTLITQDWRFTRGDPAGSPPTDTPAVTKAWSLPSGNAFLKDPTNGPQRPAGAFSPFASAAADFDDSTWQKLDLPHDFAIQGPFTTAGGGGMGRLPSAGAAWYRKTLSLPTADAGKSVFLDIDGAMSYSLVWLNGQFVGGWPYGYSSFRLDLSPYMKPGADNTLAIRLDNPPNSSRWYPGGGIYRNVWLTKTNPVHVAQWGTVITTPRVTTSAAEYGLDVSITNDSKTDASVDVRTLLYALDAQGKRIDGDIATLQQTRTTMRVAPGKTSTLQALGTIENPRLWSPKSPNRYLAVTTLTQNGQVIDTYETPFGIRTLKYDANQGLLLNGEHIRIQGVCNHHDLGALGAAFNVRAAQRQLEMLKEMGCNALRTAHNPPAPELLDLCDQMGFLVMDEAFDCWEAQKTPNDYHLLFDDWHEQDLRAMLRRDRNHPSIILWSIGNEVGEQGGDATSNDRKGIAKMLTEICHQEDPTRPTISAMNAASPTTPFAAPIDAIGLNYQGAGLNAEKRQGRRASPQYPPFHQAFPDKLILGSETASTLSTRGFYAFPVATGIGTAAAADAGEIPGSRQVSSYDMYFADWSMIPDKEWAVDDKNPFVAGEFVWTGFDYLGEPTPFDQSRSSYFGIIDLAGFKKDRFYLYQARWRPELPMVHIVPHWTWPDRAGQVTPVFVYTSGDEAELFLNGKSLGRKKKGAFEYRLRWDDVVYQPGELKVVAYKDGKDWATEIVKTAGDAAKLLLTPDHATIAADGVDLSFVTLAVADKDGQTVPRAMNAIHFAISGPGEIVATDNGDPTDMTAFPSQDRKAFNGLALAIVRAKRGAGGGEITVTASAEGLAEAKATITAK